MNEKAILKHFDNVFNTNVKKHIKLNRIMLKLLFNTFLEEIYTPSSKYRNMLIRNNRQIEELMATLNEEQKKMFESCFDTIHTMLDEQEEQVFLFGYLLAKEFDNEGNLK